MSEAFTTIVNSVYSIEYQWEGVKRSLPLSAREVYRVLRTYSNNDYKPVWPSEARIAKEAGIVVTTVRKGLDHLIAAGLISIRARKAYRAGNVYYFKKFVHKGSETTVSENDRDDKPTLPKNDSDNATISESDTVTLSDFSPEPDIFKPNLKSGEPNEKQQQPDRPLTGRAKKLQEDFESVVVVAEKFLKFDIDEKTREKIAAAIVEFGMVAVKDAIEIASDRGAKRWGYIEGIFKNWRKSENLERRKVPQKEESEQYIGNTGTVYANYGDYWEGEYGYATLEFEDREEWFRQKHLREKKEKDTSKAS